MLTADGYRPIETVRVGDRVITSEESLDGESDVEPALWKLVTLHLDGGEGSELEIKGLRSPGWLASVAGEVGAEIWLEIPQIGVSGIARVVSIEPCPPVHTGPGRVVLSTYSRTSNEVMQLWLEGIAEPLEVTADHPLYSVTRDAWVAAADLFPTEQLWALSGPVTVEGVSWKGGSHQVYTLEVEHEHVFFASQIGILSHNQGCPPTGGPPAAGRGAEQARDSLGRFLSKEGGELRPGGPFEDQLDAMLRELADPGTVARQVRIQTPAGTTTVVDNAARINGRLYLFEGKASSTAGYTPNQRVGYPEIRTSGGTVTSRSIQAYPRGSLIPPTRVRTVRPGNIERMRAALERLRGMQGGAS